MTREPSRPAVETTWTTVLEASLFLFPVMAGLLFGGALVVGALVGAPGGAEGPGAADPVATAMGTVLGVGVLLFLLAAVLLALLVPVALYLDATALNDLDLEWEPEPVLYAVLGFFVSGLATLHYLWKRHRHVVDPDTWDGWWTVVGAFLLVGFAAAVLSVVVPSMAVPVVGLAAMLFGLTPAALYKDAAHVRSTDSDWRPNPVNYYLAAVFGVVLLLVVPVSMYYLFRRSQHVGTA